jgi:hypothetical protein
MRIIAIYSENKEATRFQNKSRISSGAKYVECYYAGSVNAKTIQQAKSKINQSRKYLQGHEYFFQWNNGGKFHKHLKK